MGWNSGTDQEIFSLEELVDAFSLDKVSKSGAKFDYEKGKWFNHQYLQNKSDEEIADLYMPELEAKGIKVDKATLAKIVGMVKGRIQFVKDLWGQTSFFFEAPTSYEEKAVKKRWKEETPAQLTELIDVLSSVKDFRSEPMEEEVKAWIEAKGYGLGAVMNAFRITVVGDAKGPHMFDIVEVLGLEETIKRIKRGIETIK